MIINHNRSALHTFNQLQKNNKTGGSAASKLSSGLRITKAADDASGLAISEKMRAQIRGLQQAERNIQDGISLLDTVEGGLGEITSSLQRMRELSVQAANDTLTEQDRIEIQKEIDQNKENIDTITEQTKFNGISVLNSKSVTENEIVHEGITWETIETGSDTHFYDIAWNGERYFAVGYQGNTLTSTDGVNWTKPHEPVTNVNLNSVNVVGSEFLVAEGSSVYTTMGGADRDHYKNFSSMVTNAAKVGDIYMAVGDSGMIATSNNLGDEWTEINTPTSKMLIGMATSGDEFVAVGKDGTVLLSADAESWSAVESNTDHELTDVVWADGKYVAVGSNIILTSQDGETWTERTLPEHAILSKVVYTDDEYMAISRHGQIFTSDDGITWSGEKRLGGSTEGIVWDGTQYLTIGYEGNAFRGYKDSSIEIEEEYMSLSLQIGANNGSKLQFDLTDTGVKELGVEQVNVVDEDGGAKAIENIDEAISYVSSERSRFGAYRNRLEHTLSFTNIYEENLMTSESRIRDVDMAKGVIEMTRSNILSQASQAMLAQANQKPQSVLQLLG